EAVAVVFVQPSVRWSAWEKHDVERLTRHLARVLHDRLSEYERTVANEHRNRRERHGNRDPRSARVMLSSPVVVPVAGWKVDAPLCRVWPQHRRDQKIGTEQKLIVNSVRPVV